MADKRVKWDKIKVFSLLRSYNFDVNFSNYLKTNLYVINLLNILLMFPDSYT
jgi:hypothetical protein